MDQAHVEIPHFGAVLGLIEQTILSMQNAFLQSPLDEVRIQRRARLAEEQRQPSPAFQAISDGFAQPRVGLHFLFVELGLEPSVEGIHHRLAVCLVKAQPRLGSETPPLGLGLVTIHVAKAFQHEVRERIPEQAAAELAAAKGSNQGRPKSTLVGKCLPISVDSPNHKLSRIRNDKRPSRAGIRQNAAIANGRLTFQSESAQNAIRKSPKISCLGFHGLPAQWLQEERELLSGRHTSHRGQAVIESPLRREKQRQGLRRRRKTSLDSRPCAQ